MNRITRLSLDLRAEIEDFQSEKLEACPGGPAPEPPSFLVRYKFNGVLTRAACHEVPLDILPEAIKAVGSMEWHLRSDHCPESNDPILWGCSKGRLRIRSASVLFRGRLRGTHGFDPARRDEQRCCRNTALGTWRGRSAEGKEIEICANYQLEIALNPADPGVQPPREFRLKLDGAVISPC